MEYDASKSITLPGVQNVSIGIINLTFNKSDNISDLVKDMDLDVLVNTDTWQKRNFSDQKIVGDVTSVGYYFHLAAWIRKKSEGIGILLHDSLKCETHFRFQANSFEILQMTFVSGE